MRQTIIDPREHSFVRNIRNQEYRPENLKRFAGEVILEQESALYGDVTPEQIYAAQNNILPFIEFTFPGYITDPFHASVCDYVDQVVTGEEQFLMLFAPPQHGKSEIVSTRLPSYWLMHHPDLPVALISYGGDLAKRNSVYAQNVFETWQYQRLVRDLPWYRPDNPDDPWLPTIREDPKNWRQVDWHLNEYKGYVLAAGVRGRMTGHGFGLAIIDDPIENWAAAQSDTLRESIWAWWQGTFKTRMWEQGRIVFMMTRWHEDDLAARILKQEGTVEEGGKWRVITYPALSIATDEVPDLVGRARGASLAPSRYSREYLLDIQEGVGPYVWNAEYQQSPTAPQGDFFKIGRIEIVDALPAEIGGVEFIDKNNPELGYIPVGLKKGTRYWDLAASEKKQEKEDPDSTSGTLIVEHDDIFYIVHNVNEKFGPYEVEDTIKLNTRLDGQRVRQVFEQEPGSSGISLIAHYTRMLKGFIVEGKPSSGDKRVRAYAFASQLNAGNVRMLKAPWNRRMLIWYAAFPHGKHDDDIDSSSGAFNDLTEGQRWGTQEFLSV